MTRLLGTMLIFAAIVVGYLARQGFKRAMVLVEWTTASELDMAGFNLFRSENKEGPFVQVNDQLIPSSTDPLAGGSYQFSDERVEPGRVYYYELEAVETTGSTERFGPIEVRSESGGKIELALAFLIAAVGISAIIISAPRRGGQAVVND
jgi:hypothetical protein